MKRKNEILAPVGSMEMLHAAIQNKADAVYLAGSEFGARKFAENFTSEQLIEAINYAHERNVDVFVTINTLIYNAEFDRLREYIDFLYVNNVDAVIVQDIGVLNFIRENYADLPIHCSTQMSVQTVADVKYLESLGASRVVLGREMTIEDIRRVKEETNVELEVFVHGALCISVSGQCLISSMIGGRSGNRGACAQSCRQKYKLVNADDDSEIEGENGEFLLSPKDLMTIEEVAKLVEAGAYSLKIEGRMKRPEYVAIAVAAYKSALDAAENNTELNYDDVTRRLKIFNRGFTKGHMFSARGNELMSSLLPGNQGYEVGEVIKYDDLKKKLTLRVSEDLYHNDEVQIRRGSQTIGGRVEVMECMKHVVKMVEKGKVCTINFKHRCSKGEKIYKTFDENLAKEAKNTYHKEFLEQALTSTITIEKDQNVELTVSDSRNTITVKSDAKAEEAINRALEAEKVVAQLSKLGGTPFTMEKVEVNLGEGLSIPMKVLNELRREAIEKITEARVSRYDRTSKLTEISVSSLEQGQALDSFTFSAAAFKVEQAKMLIDFQVEVIYYKDINTFKEVYDYASETEYNGELIPEVFRGLSDNALAKFLEQIKGLDIKTVLIGSYGHMDLFADYDLILDYNMNVLNDYSYDYYMNKENVKRVTLSPEMNLEQISALITNPEKTEVIGFGYLPVMLLKHCVISTTLGKGLNCGACDEDNYGLRDKTNLVFRLKKREACMLEVYNSKKLLLIDYYKGLIEAGVGAFRLNFTNETPEEVEEILEVHYAMVNDNLKGSLSAKYIELKEVGVTRGHLNRGVL